MTEQKHPFWAELESTHQDVQALHPLLTLLDQPEGSEEDPIMLIAELLAAIEARLGAIESALSPPPSTEPVEL